MGTPVRARGRERPVDGTGQRDPIRSSSDASGSVFANGAALPVADGSGPSPGHPGASTSALMNVLLVYPDAAFHRDRNADSGLHGADAVCDQFRFGHEARPEAPATHAVAERR